MENIVGIVVPPDIKAEIIEFGIKYNCTIIEPHITLVPYEMLKDAKGVERNLQSFCLSQPPFKTIIGGPSIENRPDAQVFCLTVMMGAMNATRDKLIRHLKLPPYNRVFRPYISLIEQKENAAYDFDAMLEDAKTIFSKPRSINVDALATFGRATRDEPYTVASLHQFTGR